MSASNLFPDIEPFYHTLLQVDDIHHLYIEQCGCADGQAILFLHGGPGSGCNSKQRCFFDPSTYRIVLFDQRGCGRSTPAGETRQNTTTDLIADIEKIRTHLKIERWHIFGGSWGSALALYYAVHHPMQVASLILRGIFMSRQSELDWFLGGIKHFYPEPWQTLLDGINDDEQNDIVSAYKKRIFHQDINISIPAAIRWNAYESSIMSLLPRTTPTVTSDSAIELARSRVQIHYIEHKCFVDGIDILDLVRTQLSNIPTWIIQGRYDMVCPPRSAWQLAQVMPHAKLHMVADAGHSAMEPGTCAALLQATESLKELHLI